MSVCLSVLVWQREISINRGRQRDKDEITSKYESGHIHRQTDFNNN